MAFIHGAVNRNGVNGGSNPLYFTRQKRDVLSPLRYFIREGNESRELVVILHLNLRAKTRQKRASVPSQETSTRGPSGTTRRNATFSRERSPTARGIKLSK